MIETHGKVPSEDFSVDETVEEIYLAFSYERPVLCPDLVGNDSVVEEASEKGSGMADGGVNGDEECGEVETGCLF